MKTLGQMQAWCAEAGQQDSIQSFGGEAWEEPKAVHWRPPSWSSDVNETKDSLEDDKLMHHATSLLKRRAAIKWDDGTYECSIASWNSRTGEHKCIFDDGERKFYNLYREWGVGCFQ